MAPIRTATPVAVPALDGRPLAGTLFAPSRAPRAALVVSAATGVRRRFYGRFAQHAAARGLLTLTYDYRGIGGSAPRDLRDEDARFRDWGQQDIAGALGWMRARAPGVPLVAVGHSAGGQMLGLAETVGEVAAAVFVAVSTGYWRGMAPRYKWGTLALWKAYVPLAVGLRGYAPAKAIGWGEDLPAGVAREWGAWCLEPDYLAATFDETGRRPTPDGAPFGPTFFDRASFPIRAYSFADDPIATSANVPPMLALYDRAAVERREMAPADLGADAVGHLGFFRAGLGEPLWDEALDWLLEAAGA